MSINKEACRGLRKSPSGPVVNRGGCSMTQSSTSSQIPSVFSENEEETDNEEDDDKDDDDKEFSDNEEDGEEPLSECGSSNNVSHLSTSDVNSDDGRLLNEKSTLKRSTTFEDETGDVLRYKHHYPALMNAYKILFNKHSNLLNNLATRAKSKADQASSTEPPLPIEAILDEFCLDRVSKRDLHEHKISQSGIKAHYFIAKRWKKRFYSLLEAVDLLYKDYQLLHCLANSNEDVNSILHRGHLKELHEEFKNTLASSSSSTGAGGGGGGSLQQGILEETDVSITVSSVFLADLVSQCRIYQGEISKKVQVNERLCHVLKRAKEQRAKLKVYVNALRDELRYVMYKMRESQATMANQMSFMEQQQKQQEQQRIQQLKQEEQQKQLITASNSAAVEAAAATIINVKSTPTVSTKNTKGKEIFVLQERIVELERILKEEELKRKHLHNKLQELIGNIRVYCRIRPHPNCFMKVSSDDKLVIPGDQLPDKVTRSWNTSMKCYIFDRVFGGEATQENVFDAVRELIVSCVDGFNVCIMAYGQTGSGKTHTMMGTNSNPGVNRRAVRHLLTVCQERKQWAYQLSLSMMEIYQEQIFDLLSPPDQKQLNVVKIMATQDDEVVLQNLIEQTVRDENDVFKYLEMGEKSRRVASTMMNHASSRSHFVLLLHVKGVNEVHKTSSRGTLTLCDLAGSENVSKSGATGERFQEAASINRSLTALGRVFDLLRKRQKPCYRETKLTHLLKPTLGGDSKCLLIVNIRSETQNVEESLRAIQFGQNAMQVAPEQMHRRSIVRSHSGILSTSNTETTTSQRVSISTNSSSLTKRG